MSDLTKGMAGSIMIVLFPIVLPSCKSHEGDAAYWKNEREIIELSQRLKLGEYRLGLSDSAQWKDWDDLKIVISENEVRLWNLQSEQSALTDEIERLETRNKELGRTALEQKRSRAQGIKFETFPAKDGRTFKNVTITLVDDSGVAFRHDHGAARLRYAELSDDQRSFFGLEEEAALAAEDREHRQSLAYELSIDMELEAMRGRESEERPDPIAPTNNNFLASRSLLAPSNHQREIRPLAQPARTFGSGSTYRRHYNYSGYRSYRPFYRYVYRYPPTANPFCPSSRTRSQSSGFSTGVCPSTPTTP